MKRTGFVNQIDELGRIKIPDTLLNQFKFKSGSKIEIIIDEEEKEECSI